MVAVLAGGEDRNHAAERIMPVMTWDECSTGR